ncbi:hypothetical protein [Rhizorhabdus wittichii]|uniref:hypothetical protein n=1 Tax=Rhizorhabdus wittichii TaxID=160791 RepID=UPI00178C21FC|nr:hypothetical protein [Rhizorhabdus wittichii]
MLCGLALAACGHCPSEPLKSYEPQGDITLRLERNGCGGATGGFVYEVQAYSTADRAGTMLLRFDNDHRHDWDDDPEKVLDVRWLSPRHAQIRFHYPVRVFRARATADDVTVGYDFAHGTNLMTGWFGASRIVE